LLPDARLREADVEDKSIVTIGINPGHNSSVAVVVDGELTLYVEEERLSRVKRDGAPMAALMQAIDTVDHLDVLAVVGTHGGESGSLPWRGDGVFEALVRKLRPEWEFQVVSLASMHHLTHAACAYRHSGFDQAVAVIVDGSGAAHQLSDGSVAFETESIIDCASLNDMKVTWQRLGTNRLEGPAGEENVVVEDRVGIVKAYEAATAFCGWHFIEAGKTMGLAPYGAALCKVSQLSGMYRDGRFSRDVFRNAYPAGAFLDVEGLDPNNEDHCKEVASRIQSVTEAAVMRLIEKAVEMTGKKQVVIAGGYGLNCVANYEFAKRFPDLDLWFEPLAYDGGTAMGAAYMAWANLHAARCRGCLPGGKLTSLYLGPEQDPETYDLSGFDKVVDANAEGIAQMIADGELVTIFQGRSEAGPRALGNRSILSDPRPDDGKDRVNAVKKREWFRPFAGTVLAEKADEWFELAGMEESPYMMMAVDVHEGRRAAIPAITHVDGTCRVQTLTREQNPHYYDVIAAFEKKTSVPIVMNTSFNLGGEPLVETVDDVLKTLRKSDLNWCWFPEIGKLARADKAQ
jgi:carbamoyltransferase